MRKLRIGKKLVLVALCAVCIFCATLVQAAQRAQTYRSTLGGFATQIPVAAQVIFYSGNSLRYLLEGVEVHMESVRLPDTVAGGDIKRFSLEKITDLDTIVLKMQDYPNYHFARRMAPGSMAQGSKVNVALGKGGFRSDGKGYYDFTLRLADARDARVPDMVVGAVRKTKYQLLLINVSGKRRQSAKLAQTLSKVKGATRLIEVREKDQNLLRAENIKVSMELPSGWHVATSLEPNELRLMSWGRVSEDVVKVRAFRNESFLNFAKAQAEEDILREEEAFVRQMNRLMPITSHRPLKRQNMNGALMYGTSSNGFKTIHSVTAFWFRRDGVVYMVQAMTDDSINYQTKLVQFLAMIKTFAPY